MVITLNESDIQTLAAMEAQAILDAANGIKSYFKIYETLADWLTTRYAVSSSDPAVLWLRGATEANAGRGSMAALIREYTQTQNQLRYGAPLSDPEMQAASNAVATNLLNDILGRNAPAWRRGDVPDIARIALADAAAVGVTLFGPESGRNAQDTAFTENSAWSGTLLFSLLRSDQTNRLLGTGTSGQLDTLNDLRDVLFAYVSYANGLKAAGEVFALNALAAFGGGMLSASVQLDRDRLVSGSTLVAYYRGNRDVNALITTVKQGASGTVGSAFSRIGDVGQYRFLDMIIGAALGRALIGTTTNDEQFAANALGYFGQLSPAALKALTAEILPMDAGALAAKAASDVNARAALAALSVVSLQVSADVAARFSLYDAVTGTGNITSSWIEERAAMALWVGLGDRVLLNGGITQQRSINAPVVYKDTSTGALIRLTTAGGSLAVASTTFDSEARNVVFGGDSSDSLAGGMNGDRLYGGAGNDTLFGQAGDDYIEGNTDKDTLSGGAGKDTLLGGAGDDILTGDADNDTLMGGADFDTYKFAPGFGHDTIIDSDGLGVLQFNGTALPKGLKVPGLEKVWEDASRQYVYTLVSNATGGTDLIIGRRVTPGASTIEGTITVRNWQPGQLSIDLDQTATLPTAAITGIYSGDYIKALAPDGVTYALVNGQYASAGPSPGAHDLIGGSAGADRISGGGGKDALIGHAGDDELNGGDGVDVLLGGAGSDRLLGGAGDDFLYGSGINPGFVAPVRTTTPPPVATGPEIARGFGWVAYTDAVSGDLIVMPYNGDVSNDGSNWISGGSGNDRIGAGTGSDIVMAGTDNDWVYGMGGADILFGEDGDDHIWGDGTTNAAKLMYAAPQNHGNDVLDGGSGNDQLVGQGGDDRLYGGLGDDKLWGDEWGSAAGELGVTPVGYHGNDYLDGGAGNDQLRGGGANDELDGGDGNDNIFGDAGQSDLVGSAHGNDVIRGGAGNDEIAGNGGDDFIDGGSGNDLIYGDQDLSMLDAQFHGNDTIEAGDGDDEVVGGGGADVISGGNGRDILYGSDGNDRVDGDTGDDVIYGEAGNDVLIGGEGADGLHGGEGDDWLEGGAGTDYLNGGDGNDTYVFRAGDSPLSAENAAEFLSDSSGVDTVLFEGKTSASISDVGAAGTALFIQFGGGNTLAIENGAGGAIEKFSFSGSSGAFMTVAQLVGSHGQTTITSRTPDGLLVVHGGRNNDQVSFTESRATVSGGQGNDTLVGNGSGNTYLFEAGDGKDVVTDSAWQGTGYGAFGASRIQLGAGLVSAGTTLTVEGGRLVLNLADSLGTTFDQIALAGFDANNAAGPISISSVGFGDGSSLSISQIVARGFDFVGTTGDDDLQGTNLQDRFAGSVGNDTLAGGLGADIYQWGAQFGADRVVDVDSGIASSDTLDLSATHTSDQLWFTRVGSDLLVRQRGTTDGVTVVGQFLGTGAGVETVQFMGGVAWTRADILANLSLVLTEGPDWVTGTEAADFILAGGGSDIVNGAGGDDTLDGQAGDDYLRGGAGNDRLFGGEGIDQLDGDDGNDLLSDGLFEDYLFGGSGNDELRGGLSMTGGTGSDRYVLDSWPFGKAVVINESVSAEQDVDELVLPYINGAIGYHFSRAFNNTTDGNDDLLVTYDGNLGYGSVRVVKYFYDDPQRAGLEVIRLPDGSVLDFAAVLAKIGGTTATPGNDSIAGFRFDETWDGGAGNDIIGGAGGHDTLMGGTGSDRLYGGTGNDTLDGGEGVDRLDGGTGADRYRFGRSSGMDQISESGSATAEVDTVVLDAGISPADVTLYRDGTDLILVLDSSNTQLRVLGHFNTTTGGANSDRAIERIEFAGGTVWVATDINARTVVGTPNTMQGTPGNDTFTVDDARDVVVELAGSGTDTLMSSVSYRLPENVENGTLTGLLNTSLFGNDGSNVLRGNAGSNALNGGFYSLWDTAPDWSGWSAGADTLIGGAGDDIYWVNGTGVYTSSYWSLPDDTVVEDLNAGTDLIVSNTFSHFLPANVENLADVYWSGAWTQSGSYISRTLAGNELNNVIDAKARTTDVSYEHSRVGGAITIDGGLGADTMIGGHDDTTYVVDNLGDQVIETGTSSLDTVESSISYTLGEQIENLRLIGSQEINGSGNAANNQLDGSRNAASNVLQGGLGDDLYILGDGDTAIEFFGEGNDTIFVISAPSQPTVFSLANFANVENMTLDRSVFGGHTLAGTSGPDMLTYLGKGNADSSQGQTTTGGSILAGAGDDTLQGGSGDDLLDGGSGIDAMYGGAGSDVYRVDATLDRVIENQNEGYDTVEASVDFILEFNVEAAVAVGEAPVRLTGNSGSNALWGNEASNVIQGLAGDDTLHVSSGLDLLQGGGGSDTYAIKPSSFVDGSQSLTTIQDVSAPSGQADRVQFAMPASNWTWQRQGEDLRFDAAWLPYGTVQIVIERVFASSDRSSVEIFEFADRSETVASLFPGIIEGSSGNDVLFGTAYADYISGGLGDDQISGVGGSDTLDGGAGSDLLDGGTGNDTLIGGEGDDTFVVDSTADQTIETADAGWDDVFASLDWTLAENIEGLHLQAGATTGIGNELDNYLEGSDTANILYGLGGDDQINGQAGLDTMVGGVGNDTYYVQDLGDVVFELDNEGVDTVLLYSNNPNYYWFTLPDHVENLDASGDSLNHYLGGNSLNNTLIGGSGDDSLNGEGGLDLMLGGQGNDTYFVQDGGDVIVELSNGGVDTVLLYPYDWQFIAYTAPGEIENIDASGHWSGMALTGNELDNTLTGSALADTLNGMAGNDTLIGGAGADTYIFSRGSGYDNVQESDTTANVIDKVQFGAGITQSDTRFVRIGDHLEVSVIGTTDKLVVQNWYAGIQHHVELFQYADGTSTTSAQVDGMVSAMAAFVPDAAFFSERGLIADSIRRASQWRQTDLAVDC